MGEYLEETKKRMLGENPHLVKFLERQVGRYSPELQNHLFEIAVSMYAILEHQAEANKFSFE